MESGSNTLIGRYEHLAKRSQHEKAKELLMRTGSLVKPIMKKHDWKVGTLAEFVPGDASLLGMNQNRGYKILLRLRPHEAQDTFYDQEQLVLVMLHELTHNVHGPHDAKFYKLLGELEKEWHELKRSGYSGEGFLSEGKRLGGSHGTPLHIGRIKALEAAEKRVAKQKLIGKGGKLGAGPGSRTGKSMREVLLEATERRLKDDKSCAHGVADVDYEVRKAAAESEGQDGAEAEEQWSEAIDVDAFPDIPLSPTETEDFKPVALSDSVGTQGAASTASQPSSRRESPSNASTTTTTTTTTTSKSKTQIKEESASGSQATPSSTTPAARPRRQTAKAVASPPPTNSFLRPDGWTCATCTLDNALPDLACQACGQSKPTPPGFWTCDFCATLMEGEFRCCRGCGYVRHV